MTDKREELLKKLPGQDTRAITLVSIALKLLLAS
jgi:hypothetical protein